MVAKVETIWPFPTAFNPAKQKSLSGRDMFAGGTIISHVPQNPPSSRPLVATCNSPYVSRLPSSTSTPPPNSPFHSSRSQTKPSSTSPPTPPSSSSTTPPPQSGRTSLSPPSSPIYRISSAN